MAGDARAAGLPAGMTITPDMARMAAQSLSRMSPQVRARKAR